MNTTTTTYTSDSTADSILESDAARFARYSFALALKEHQERMASFTAMTPGQRKAMLRDIEQVQPQAQAAETQTTERAA